MAEKKNEAGNRFTVDDREVSQVRYVVRLDKASVLPKIESADVRLFKGRKELAAYDGLTVGELEKLVGPYNKTNLENGVGANKNNRVEGEIKGKLEKLDLTPGAGTAEGLESKYVAPKVQPKHATPMEIGSAVDLKKPTKETRNEAALARQTTAETAVVKSEPVGSNELEPTNTPAIPSKAIPKAIEDAYLRVGDKFHYTGKPDLQAFEDKGNKLETKSNSETVAADLVKIANARGWENIKVKGSEEFRRHVWLEASLQGMEVTGYKPTEADQALLRYRDQRGQHNSVERIPDRAHGGRLHDRGNSTTPAPASSPAKRSHADFSGVLLEHGAAKYEFKDDEKESYFVKLQEPGGEEKTIWGVDLARAIRESNAQVGQQIELKNLGQQPVVVNVPVKNAEGHVVGTKAKETHRNAWEIKAEAFRTQDPKVAVKEHPDLVNAYAIVRAAEITAKQNFKTVDDQSRFVGLAKETIAKKIEENQAIPKVSIKERQQVKIQNRELDLVQERTQER
jgi:putative DNA primase/helicase